MNWLINVDIKVPSYIILYISIIRRNNKPKYSVNMWSYQKRTVYFDHYNIQL